MGFHLLQQLPDAETSHVQLMFRLPQSRVANWIPTPVLPYYVGGLVNGPAESQRFSWKIRSIFLDKGE